FQILKRRYALPRHWLKANAAIRRQRPMSHKHYSHSTAQHVQSTWFPFYNHTKTGPQSQPSEQIKARVAVFCSVKISVHAQTLR
ncbi:hypothetical protein BaRGS_00036675, partial [Batillaria attramentaria]